MSDPTSSLPPGFRFHPTDEELILHYLKKRAASSPCPVSIIAEVDIYKSDPWDLPGKAAFGDREWYFFSPRDRKYPNGNRPNRAAASGYWKATGTDKPIHTTKSNEHVGVKKALVFYTGKPPRGIKTDWIMHEYRLAEPRSSNSYKPMKLRDSSMRLDDWVLCRIYKKASHQPAMESPAMNPESSTGTDSVYLSAIEQNISQQHTLRFPKPSSISDFLDFFDNLPEDLSGKLPVITNSNDGNEINHFAPQLSESGSALKRQRTGEEENASSLHSSNRWNEETSFANQFESPQYSMMSQYSLFHQQMLLNSQFGFQ